MVENNTINVLANASFVENESNAAQNHYLFAYTITITNTGKTAAQLLQRHWILTDANGLVQEIHGEGVIGLQPRIKAGENFCYTSGALIETPVGTMQGYYIFTDSENTFQVQIPRFTLSIPRTLH